MCSSRLTIPPLCLYPWGTAASSPTDSDFAQEATPQHQQQSNLTCGLHPFVSHPSLEHGWQSLCAPCQSHLHSNISADYQWDISFVYCRFVLGVVLPRLIFKGHFAESWYASSWNYGHLSMRLFQCQHIYRDKCLASKEMLLHEVICFCWELFFTQCYAQLLFIVACVGMLPLSF